MVEPAQLPSAIEYALAGRQWVEVLDHPEADWLSQALRALRGLGIVAKEPVHAAEGQSIVAPSPTGASVDSVADAAPRHNLPAPVASFVGRVREVAEVKERLQSTRLVTLTGTGGCGKTRLALEVGANLLNAFADGVWLVELAPLSDSTLVPGAVAAALGVREGPGRPIQATLLSFLRLRRLVLLLDNCEHLIDGCARLADTILRSCSGVRILATSREALGIGGEMSWRVPSLAFPPVDRQTTLAELAASEAICLFVERARAVQPRFSLTEQNASTVAQICRRLDGIPLAIELAATRVKALAVEQIAARLDQRFRLLSGGSRAALPRQQTLAALVGWSYDLLTEAQRILFNRLSVFAGSFALEAVETVCADENLAGATVEASSTGTIAARPPIRPEDVLDLLAELVEKSLVVADGGNGDSLGHYRLLETLRQYGQERLVDTGEAEALHGQHARYYLDVAERSEPHLRRAEQLVYLARLDQDGDNVRAALRWFLDSEQVEEGLRLIDALIWFWVFRGQMLELRTWISQFLPLSGVATPSPARTNARVWAGTFAYTVGDLAVCRRRLAESLAMAQKLGDERILAWVMLMASRFGGPDQEQWYQATPLDLAEGALARYRAAGDRWGISETLTWLGRLAFLQGDSDQARLLLTESLAVARTVGDRRSVAGPLEVLGQVISVGSDDEAGAALNESLHLYREVGDLTGIISVQNLLGLLDYLHGRFGSAREHFRASLDVSKDWTWVLTIAGALHGLALVAAGQGQPERALRLAGAVASLWDERTIEASPIERSALNGALASARKLLGPEAAAAAWADGSAMTRDVAIMYALDGDDV